MDTFKKLVAIARMGQRQYAEFWRVAVVVALGVAVGACWAALVPAGAADEVVVDGVPHFRNGSRPSQGTTTLRLQEQWRAGGEGSDVLLGLVTEAQSDTEGNVYVLDRQLSQAHVFGPDGSLVRTLGREGDGPGELRFPTNLILLPDGRVGVSRVMPGSIVLLARDGTPAGMIHIGETGTSAPMQFLDEVLCEANRLVVSGRSVHRNAGGVERELYVGILDLSGKEQTRLMSKRGSDPIMSRKYVERDEHWVSRGGMAADRDGRVYLAQERDRYAISVYSPEGKLERVIERECHPRKRTAEEKAQVGSGMVAIVNGERVRFEIVAEDYPPRIQGMNAMRNGELWVVGAPETDALPAGILQVYDVFNPGGEFTRQVQLAGPGDPDGDRVVLLGPDRVLVVKGSAEATRALTGEGRAAGQDATEGEPLEIICYAVVPA